MKPVTQAERITSLEVRVSDLTDEVKELTKIIAELVALKNKGAGAFWLASSLFGVSLISAAAYIASWFK
jgi:hypothetical protein